MIALITFITNTILFAIMYFVQNRLPKLRHIEILDRRKVKSVLLYSCISVAVAGAAYFFQHSKWIGLIASLINLMAISLFFNSMREWFKQTQHRKMKKEDLVAIGLWLLWLLSGSIFLANMLVCLKIL